MGQNQTRLLLPAPRCRGCGLFRGPCKLRQVLCLPGWGGVGLGKCQSLFWLMEVGRLGTLPQAMKSTAPPSGAGPTLPSEMLAHSPPAPARGGPGILSCPAGLGLCTGVAGRSPSPWGLRCVARAWNSFLQLLGTGRQGMLALPSLPWARCPAAPGLHQAPLGLAVGTFYPVRKGICNEMTLALGNAGQQLAILSVPLPPFLSTPPPPAWPPLQTILLRARQVPAKSRCLAGPAQQSPLPPSCPRGRAWPGSALLTSPGIPRRQEAAAPLPATRLQGPLLHRPSARPGRPLAPTHLLVSCPLPPLKGGSACFSPPGCDPQFSASGLPVCLGTD